MDKKLNKAVEAIMKAVREYVFMENELSPVKMGSLMVKGGIVRVPDDPTYIGDMIGYNRPDITLVDTKPGFEITWLPISEDVLVCDRNLINNISWETIEEAGFVDGKEVTIDGRKYIARLMTGSDGEKYGEEEDNEWDKMMDLYNESNDMTHFEDMYSWCKEAYYRYSSSRSIRGYITARYYNYGTASYANAYIGLRLALQRLDTASEDE